MGVSAVGVSPALVASSQTGIAVQVKAQDAAKIEGEGILKMISPPGTGQNVNALA